MHILNIHVAHFLVDQKWYYDLETSWRTLSLSIWKSIKVKYKHCARQEVLTTQHAMVNSSEMLPTFEIDQVKIIPVLEQSCKHQSTQKMMHAKPWEEDKEWRQNISVLYYAQVLCCIMHKYTAEVEAICMAKIKKHTSKKWGSGGPIRGFISMHARTVVQTSRHLSRHLSVSYINDPVLLESSNYAVVYCI